MNRQVKADLLLVMMTFFWGASYVFTKIGLDEVSPLMLSVLRFGIGFASLWLVFGKRLGRPERSTLKLSAVFGLLLAATFALQTFSLLFTSVSAASFLINLTVIFVPLLSFFVTRQPPEKSAWVGAFIALIGVILLTGVTRLAFNLGDFLAMLCALTFSVHMLMMGTVARGHDPIVLGSWQLFFAGIYSLGIGLFVETAAFPVSATGWGVVLFLAVFCTAGGFVGQSYAQQITSPTHTALIFILEPVFGAAIAYAILGERLSDRGVLGAVLILTATLVTEFRPVERMIGLLSSGTQK